MLGVKQIFNNANKKFLSNETTLIKSDVSERCLCGSLKSYLEREVTDSEKYKNYYVDVEYNRNAGKIKTIINNNLEIIKITCDIIVHSRGEIEKHDNLIAIEMKKSYQPEENKLEDKKRLIALTKSKSNNETWSYDGKIFPKHVCGYLLGVYYEIDLDNKIITTEFYRKGHFIKKINYKLKL